MSLCYRKKEKHMQKKIIPIIFILFLSVVSADESLKAEHDKMIKQEGDTFFFKGTHKFVMFTNIKASVYKLADQKNIYTYQQNRKYYRIAKFKRTKSKATLGIHDKIILNGKTFLFKYNIHFILGEKNGGIFVAFAQKNNTSNKLVHVIIKHANNIYKKIRKKQNDDEILECVEPQQEIYKDVIPKDKNSREKITCLRIKFTRVSGMWMWQTKFPSNHFHKKIDGEIIDFDDWKFSSSNVMSPIVRARRLANNIVCLELRSCSYRPNNLTKSVSGSVRVNYSKTEHWWVTKNCKRICNRCGEIKGEAHSWTGPKCNQRCIYCNKTKEGNHRWGVNDRCIICGKER